ncbi:MAG: V-type ATP synthase subunit E family protein [Candidatus Sedimenticola sp. (ex Thyasira tokunagai)]
MDQVNELELAILSRANRLAVEYRERAEHSRDNILRDAHEKLHLREEREVLIAKSKAERSYRRQVQSNELKLHKEMDHLRWNLVEGVLERLTDRMQALADKEQEYLPLLKAFIHKGTREFEQRELVVEVNARDLERLQSIWENFAQEAAPDKQLTLSTTPTETLGGVLIRTEDNRIRLNNTYEGRLERLSDHLHQVIIERLLPAGLAQESRETAV